MSLPEWWKNEHWSIFRVDVCKFRLNRQRNLKERITFLLIQAEFLAQKALEELKLDTQSEREEQMTIASRNQWLQANIMQPFPLEPVANA